MPSTAVGFKQRVFRVDRPNNNNITMKLPNESADFPIDDAMLARMRMPNSVLQLTPIRIRPSEVHVYERLGNGAFGVAYQCVVRGQSLVVKVPHDIKPTSSKKAAAAATLPEEVVEENRRRNYSSDFLIFRDELRNAERFLEPLSYHHREQAEEGEDFLRLNQVADIHAEMARMRAHPGHQHFHRIVHGEMSGVPYPMLFSERCDGALYQRPQFGNWDILRTPEWTNLAKQLLFAFDYMRLRGLYHMDIKPDNIFFIGQRYMLADFGECLLANQQSHNECASSIAQVLLAAIKCTSISPLETILKLMANNTDEVTRQLPKLCDGLEISDRLLLAQQQEDFEKDGTTTSKKRPFSAFLSAAPPPPPPQRPSRWT